MAPLATMPMGLRNTRDHVINGWSITSNLGRHTISTPRVPIPKPKLGRHTSVKIPKATTTDDLDATDAVAHSGDPLLETVEKLATWQWLERK